MKELKLTKGIQMILGAVLLLIVGIIIVAVLLNNNNAMAYSVGEMCPNCKEGNLYLTSDYSYHVFRCDSCTAIIASESHTGGIDDHPNGECTVCEYPYVTHGQDSSTLYYHNYEDGTHQVYNKCKADCGVTYYVARNDCSYNPSGVCMLGYYTTSTDGNTGGDSNGDETETPTTCSHTWEAKKDDTQHWNECSICGEEESGSRGDHGYGSYTDNGDGTHSRTCADCSYEEAAVEHEFDWEGTLDSHKGTCVCGAEETGEHTWGPWVDAGQFGHDHYCTVCGYFETYNHTGGNHDNGGICEVCKYQYQDHSATGEPLYYADHENMHIPVYQCAVSNCTEKVLGNPEEHSGVTHENGGKCEVCEYQCEIHEATDEIVDYTDENMTTHTPLYKCSFEGCEGTHKGTPTEHKDASHDNGGKCTECDYQYQIHEATEKIVNMEKTETTHTPIYSCSFDGCESTWRGETTEHTGGTHENDGICTACDYQYQIHGVSEEFADYDRTETGHTELYKCTFEGCEGTHEVGEEEAHTGATHDNEGKCTVCEYQYETHGETKEILKYEQHPTVHVTLYKCSHEGCTTSYVGEAQDHLGATHDNEGKCTTCEYQYQIHGVSEELVDYEKTEKGHTELYKCTFEGCEETHKVGEEEAHTGATHDNGGICEVCEYQYQIHEKTNTRIDCIGHENGHTALYKCSFKGCTVPFAGTTESHTGGTHANDGICTECGYQYQIHGISTEFAGYKQTPTGHTKTYKCTFEGCEEVHVVGEEEKHTGATHDNGGICTVCEYQYEIHGQTEEIVGYAEHESVHNPLYKCSHPSCTQYYQGLAEDHSGATHENGGKCDVCKYTYEKHDPADKPDRYQTTANAHTPIYKCTFAGCTKTHTGETENHSGGTHENDGKCETCNYQYQTHGVSNEIKYYDIKEQNHTPIYKCTHDGCEGTHVGTTQSHLGGTHDNGGKCTSCLYQYQVHMKTETISEYKKTEAGHTAMYKCSQNGCTSLYAGDEQHHILSQWTSNGSETHGAECTVCEYEVSQDHNYDENGICGHCGAKQPRLEVSSNVYKIDDKYISKVKEGTTVKQFIENIETNATEIKLYDKDNNLQDDTNIMKTGMSLELKYLNETRTFKIAVNGDATGDGKVEFSDMIAINMHLLNRRTLQNEYFVAADVTRDAKVEFNDFLKINIYMLSRISEL